MTIQTTEAPAEQDIQQDPRDAMMHAFAVAETVVAQLPDRPSSITLDDVYQGSYAIVLYFHRQPEQVRRFAAHFDVAVSAEPHGNEASSTYTSAECTVDGVRVRGWSLMRTELGDEPQSAVTA